MATTSSGTEPFPQLFARKPLIVNSISNPNGNETKATRRRKSSGLGQEIRAGDTGAPAIATLDVTPPSPNTIKAQAEEDRKKPFSKRRKAKSLFRRWRNYALKNTWVTPLVLILIFLGLYAPNPTPTNPIHRFIFLSYQIPNPPGTASNIPIQYGKGKWDFAFVFFYVIVLSFSREFIMQLTLRPLALRAGLKSRAKQARFMEQMYTAIYFLFLGPLGMYVMSRTPVWYFNTRGMYEGFPHKTHEGIFKFYYLFQAAYWAQQAIVLVLGMEKPRKDFKELVGHHIVSLALIAMSYRFHFTYMGLAVFITHDISDFFLATSKTLNYLDHPLVGPYFAFFIFVWIYMRHYLNIRILISEFFEFQTVGPYVLDWAGEQFKCPLSHYISTSLLASLQCLNIFWLYYILRIAFRIVFFNVVQDDRSDDEETELAEEREAEKLKIRPRQSNTPPKLMVNGKALTANLARAQIPMNGFANRQKAS